MPRAPRLGTLFVAAQLVDWAFFALLLLGIERMRITPGISAMNPMDLYHLPYTHSLLGSALFAAGFGAVVFALTRKAATAMIAAAVALSHWFLDLLVHIPDLTLAGSPPKLGLGLWNYPAVEMPLELAITFAALLWYARKRDPGRKQVIALGAALIVLQAINWFGPVATEVTAGTSMLAFFAYGVATVLAWRCTRSEAGAAAKRQMLRTT